MAATADSASTPVDLVERRSVGLARTGASAAVYLSLSYLASSMSGVPMFGLLLKHQCGLLHLEGDACQSNAEANAKVAAFLSTWSLCSGLTQVGTCSFYGVLGDAFGRRWALLMPISGSLLQAMAVYLVPGDMPTLLLVSGFVTSAFGGGFVTNHAATATLADVTQGSTPAMRSKVFSLVEASMYGALLFGPVLGGVFSTALGNETFLIIAAINALNLAIAFFTYKETIEPERRRAFSWRRANPLAALSMFTEGKAPACLGGLFAGGMGAQTAGTATMGLWAHQVLGFSQIEMGLQASVYLASCFVGLLFLMPLLANVLKLTTMMSIGLGWQALIWLCMAVARTRVSIYGVLCLATLNATFFPIVRTGVTNIFGKARYGESLAALGTLEQLVDMSSKVAFNELYSATNTVTFQIGSMTFGNMVFPCASAMALIGVVFSLFLNDIPKNVDADESQEALHKVSILSVAT